MELAMATSKLFKGKETTKEEKGEAKALKSGKISVAQYMKGEKSEGEKPSKKTAMAIKSGKMSPAQYAKQDKKEKK
jgi:hypothetical protein